MEPVTHFLTGACIGRAGLNRKTAYATVAAVLAAEAADIDMLWAFAGPVEELKHHRGITHTFLAAPVLAGVVVGGIWLWHSLRERRRARRGAAPNQNARAPVALNLGWLYLSALIAALSHLLLDWTNNYGVRPFFPFNPRWYAGSFVYIVEPVLLALLLMAMIVPWLFGLADSEIGARRKPFRGRGWAIVALTGMVMLWCWRWAEQAQARAMLENIQVTTAPVTRLALEPYPVNPFRWHAILETADLYQTGEIDTHSGEILSNPIRDVIISPPTPSLPKPPSAHLLVRSTSTGESGPWSATLARNLWAPCLHLPWLRAASGPPSSSAICALPTPFWGRAAMKAGRRWVVGYT
jgi:inner membrane protein